jgi:predicted GNAT superfamily acetyltransferase
MPVIRPVRTLDEFRTCEELQKQVWHFDDREVVPKTELIAVQRSGGVVLGAFDRGRMVGFAFALPGLLDGTAYLSSRMLAVLPGVRNRGVGFQLKLAQRDYARRMGLPLIAWTFDPLQSLNAYLNLEKLGVVIHEYLVNLYGTMTSPLSRGMDTDRFVPEWWIGSRWVREALGGRRPKLEPAELLGKPGWAPANGTFVADGLRAADEAHLRRRERRLLVEIPADIQAVKQRSLDAAREWRAHTRRIFQHYLRRGWAVTRFATGTVDDERRSFYVLEKGAAVPGGRGRTAGRI